MGSEEEDMGTCSSKLSEKLSEMIGRSAVRTRHMDWWKSSWKPSVGRDRLTALGGNVLPYRFCVALLGLWLASGQMNTGEISGSVQDPSGSVLPGATIVAQQAETAQKFTAVTNSSGEYLFPQLPVGVYSLSATATNFKQSTLPRFDVHASDRLRRDFTLQLGDRTEVVTVQIETGNVQME